MLEGKNGGRTGGWLVVLFGAAFLLQSLQIIDASLANILWSTAVILYGLNMTNIVRR